MKKILFITIGIISGVFVSCGQTSKEKAVLLNNDALTIISNNQDNVDSLRKAIVILDKAIDNDATNYTPIANKVGCLCRIEQFDDAFITLDKAQKLFSNNYTIPFTQGIIKEYQNDTIEAKKYYQVSLQLFESEYIKSQDKNRAVERELIKAMINNKVDTVMLNSFLDMSDESLKLSVEILRKFNRQQYILTVLGINSPNK